MHAEDYRIRNTLSRYSVYNKIHPLCGWTGDYKNQVNNSQLDKIILVSTAGYSQ